MRRSATFELMLPPRPKKIAARLWLYASVRDGILEGRLRPGGRLPGTRDLAAQYGLSRGTIVSAFEQLAAEGYLEGTVGSGTYVSRVLPDDLFLVPRAQSIESGTRPPKRHLSRYVKHLDLTS